MTCQHHLFTENYNGPYGPQEPLLRYEFQKLWPNIGVMERNLFLGRVGKLKKASLRSETNMLSWYLQDPSEKNNQKE